MKSIIQARNLCKKFGDVVAVNHLNFDVFSGECLGILGPNGAGKTTTLRMVLGLTALTEGTLSVLNYVIPEQSSIMRREVGVVPQHDNLDPDFSVIENLYTYASYFGLPRAGLKTKINELLIFAELESKANAKVTTLSGGMKRRLILARALLNQPKLLILDEPTTGLDPQSRLVMWQRLRMLRNKGTTLILTTHYLEEAERLCNRLLLVDHGNIIAQGAPSELIKKHVEPNVIEIYGEGAAVWYAAHKNSKEVARIEMIGETVFCYCQESSPLIEQLKKQSELEYMHRRANLEDVFLKLTGRELRDV